MVVTRSKAPLTKVKSPAIISQGGARLAVWKKVAGVWKNREHDPVRELRSARLSWKRRGV